MNYNKNDVAFLLFNVVGYVWFWKNIKKNYYLIFKKYIKKIKYNQDY